MHHPQNAKEKGITVRVAIPSGVSLDLDTVGNLTVRGAKGSTERQFMHPLLTLTNNNTSLVLAAPTRKKKSKQILQSYTARLQNMIRGVTEGFGYTLKICSGHFPITVKHEGSKVIISNFLGEKTPRMATILPGVTVRIEKDLIHVTATSREAAGQTAANIETATHIKGRDRRVFQDGIYIIEKPERKL